MLLPIIAPEWPKTDLPEDNPEYLHKHLEASMHLKRFADARPYEAPNHFHMTGLRLQGFEDNGPDNQWVGLSHFLPGGGAGPDATPFEKVYVVIEGELTVIINGEETTLGKYDSCTIPPHEIRTIENRRNEICTMLVVIPYPAETQS